MAFIPALNTVRVAVEMTQNGHLAANIYHIQSASPIASADLTTIGGLFASWLAGHLVSLLSVNITANNIAMRDLTTSASLIGNLPLTSGNVGTVSGFAKPNNSALVVSWRTGLAGRSFRGRTYVPGIADADTPSSPNQVSSGYATSMATAFGALSSAVATAGYDLVIASFRHAGAPRTTAVLTHPTAIIVNELLDSQRGRMKNAS